MTYDQARSYKMPCGEYEGWSLDHVPMDYLIWVADNWEADTDEDNDLVAAACVVWEYLDERWGREHPDMKPKPEKPNQNFTIEAQAKGELKAALDSAPKGLF